MNIKRYLERPKSHYERTRLHEKQNKEVSHSKSQCRQNNFFSEVDENDLDEFFDKFHDTFVVLQTTAKAKIALNKTKKPLPIELKSMKEKNPYFVKKDTKKEGKSFSYINQNSKPTKAKASKSILNKNNKTCQSERNILANCPNNVMATKKRSQKKSEAQSKKKSSHQNSRKCTTKKKMYGTGSTATTTLGNSSINLKDDIHIASYLRIKIKGH